MPFTSDVIPAQARDTGKLDASFADLWLGANPGLRRGRLCVGITLLRDITAH
jgi:hypothetical protein